MTDLTQQRIVEYEQFLIDLLEKLKISDSIYSKETLFNNLTNMKMSEMLDVDENGVNFFRLESQMKQFTDLFRRKLT